MSFLDGLAPITLWSFQKRITEYISYQICIKIHSKNFILSNLVSFYENMYDFFSFFDRPKRNILTQQTKKISQPQHIWRIFILQFFAQIFIKFVSKHISLHNRITDSYILTIVHYKNSGYCWVHWDIFLYCYYDFSTYIILSIFIN